MNDVVKGGERGIGETKAPAIDFDTPKLAAAVEQLSSEEIDRLPFGVIGLDAQNVVRVYSKTEQQFSGNGQPTLGRLFFVDVAPCMDNGYFKGRIDRARQAGALDISFAFVGDFSDRGRELSVRVQSAKDGGLWIFHKRAGGTARAEPERP